jgi:hypothetical protein
LGDIYTKLGDFGRKVWSHCSIINIDDSQVIIRIDRGCQKSFYFKRIPKNSQMIKWLFAVLLWHLTASGAKIESPSQVAFTSIFLGF